MATVLKQPIIFFDNDVDKLINEDMDAALQDFIQSDPSEDTTKFFTSHKVMLRNLECELICCPGDRIHCFWIFQIMFGYDRARIYYRDYFRENVKDMIFFEFSKANLKSAVSKLKEKYPETEKLLREFLDEKVLIDIYRQCDFSFVENRIEAVIDEGNDYIFDHLRNVFHSEVDGITEEEHNRLLHYAKLAVQKEAFRLLQEVNDVFNYSERQKVKAAKRQRIE